MLFRGSAEDAERAMTMAQPYLPLPQVAHCIATDGRRLAAG